MCINGGINMRKQVSILVFSLCIIMMLNACSAELDEQNSTEALNEKENELVLAIGGEVDDGFDPTTGWGRYGSPLFQSTLLTYDIDFNIEHDLATDYVVSDDGLNWTVTLRDELTFSDGELLTASDVVFTYETAKTSGSIIDLTNVEKIEALDDQTVQFELAEPDSTFIYLLTTIGIVPEHAYDDTYNENPIGSGPYKLVQWDKDQQLIVEKNPYYDGNEPYFEKLTFLFLSEDAAFAAAKAGEVDVVAVPPIFADETIPQMRLIELESVDNRGIMFPYVKPGQTTEEGNPIGHEVTSDIAIRKAINIAIDRQALVDGVLEGYGTPAYTVADKLPWWNEETVIADNDLDGAKKILDEAGWQTNENGVREKDGIKAEFTLYYPADDQTRQSLAMAFSQMMEPLHIAVKTEGKSWHELESLMSSEPMMMGWGSQDPLELYNLYSSKTQGIGSYNTNYYANETVDKYMEQAMRATTQDEANMWWKKAQWDGEAGFSAQGDAPWAWLVNLKHLYFIREGLEIGSQRIQPHGHGWPITDFIQDWYWQEEKEG